MKIQKEKIFGWKPDYVNPLPKRSNGFYFTPSNSILAKAHKTVFFILSPSLKLSLPFLSSHIGHFADSRCTPTTVLCRPSFDNSLP